MSEWKVSLTFQEGGSSKFWRARTEGSTLYVNFGKIGSAGQTQMKAFPSPDGAEKELAKLEREKRKKGYLDEGSERSEESEGSTNPAPDVSEPSGPEPRASAISFTLEAEGRSVELSLALEGKAVRTTVIERYPSEKAAAEALHRLSEGMEAEGYRRKR